MARISRRSFVAGMAVLPVGLSLKDSLLALPFAPRVRYEARTAEGKAMLKIYRDAVNIMMNSIAKGDPRNWIFQWYTHAVPPQGSAQNKATEIQNTYPTSTPYKALAEAMWNTCQAHKPTDVEDFFLPWHRMFVYYFENIIRYVAKNDSFTLPYWNYSAGQESAKIPEEFRSGVLLKTNRNPGVNSGNPISSDARLDALPSLRESCYSPQSGVIQGFNLKLDSGLHGNVHVDIGDTTNMGRVPWAGGDPVFWMHHCNIDRLWASWNHFGGKNPGGTWGAKEFTFAKTDGMPVKTKCSEVDNTAKLNYTYDRLEPAPPGWRPCPVRLLTTQAVTFATVSHAVALEKRPVRVPLGRAPLLKNRKMADEIQSLGDQKALYLVLKNLETNAQPGVLYDLYLDLPENGGTGDANPNYVGSINFFDAEHSHAANANQKFYSFDVTDVARKLQTGGGLPEQPTVTIAPAGEPAGDAKPVVGQIALVEK